MPLKLTLWGLSPALSVTTVDPVRLPTAVGVNVIVIVQLAPAATELPQVLVCEKSPLTAMLVMLSARLPELVSVTGFDELVVLIS